MPKAGPMHILLQLDILEGAQEFLFAVRRSRATQTGHALSVPIVATWNV